jgi:hypothetical protein
MIPNQVDRGLVGEVGSYLQLAGALVARDAAEREIVAAAIGLPRLRDVETGAARPVGAADDDGCAVGAAVRGATRRPRSSMGRSRGRPPTEASVEQLVLSPVNGTDGLRDPDTAWWIPRRSGPCSARSA